MALTLPTNVRNAMCDALVDLIDVGSGTAVLSIGTTAMAVTIVEPEFADPAFGAAAVGVATADTIVDGTAVATNTAAAAEVLDQDGADVITGLTVGTSATDVILSSLSITTGDKVEITAMTITMPAS